MAWATGRASPAWGALIPAVPLIPWVTLLLWPHRPTPPRRYTHIISHRLKRASRRKRSQRIPLGGLA